ncbi:NAD(P)-dependent oxidoreductase [uncultured Tateyamaria sp.]|uniref:NAD(P)-dependent oxidoreductase n=1 Tax=uncultured Tateyamaria sp. TaxID=455651 RepID=UPI002614CBCB|nr:NAD(P)-dependent oxidoreductase [uncultured Tateyamaria sp.]
MPSVGVIGLGDMGSGLAKNLIANGFETWGRDLLDHRQRAFEKMGGHTGASTAEVGRNAQAVFVMVMKGAEAHEVILGPDGLAETMAPGGVILLTATVKPAEARAIAQGLAGRDLHLIDSPVSGGFPGAQAGTLTMMAAGTDTAMDIARPVMEAVSANIHRVGTDAGDGQTVKACLQSLIGAQFSATFEAAALAAKAGVPGQVILDVFSTSSAGCGVVNNALEKIIDRQFEGTGSHINTMHKDLTISMALGEELGVPLHTAASAMQVFHAGRTRYPDGDNWTCTQVIEEIVGAELHRDAAKVTR